MDYLINWKILSVLFFQLFIFFFIRCSSHVISSFIFLHKIFSFFSFIYNIRLYLFIHFYSFNSFSLLYHSSENSFYLSTVRMHGWCNGYRIRMRIRKAELEFQSYSLRLTYVQILLGKARIYLLYPSYGPISNTWITKTMVISTK